MPAEHVRQLVQGSSPSREERSSTWGARRPAMKRWTGWDAPILRSSRHSSKAQIAPVLCPSTA
ncbi:hypothetical protein ABZ726_18935 [Streptomyces hundungensis]|uniref:hypothetical protein n=1 Tax=Streptomyces hundungensis TaxID=1077946 RepID=UPI0033D9DE72